MESPHGLTEQPRHSSCRIHDVTLTQFAFFKIDPYGAAAASSSFVHQAAGINSWVAERFGQSSPRTPAAELAQRLEQVGAEPGWVETVFPKTSGTQAGSSYAVLVNCWHDTASWVVVTVCPVEGAAPPSDQPGDLGAAIAHQLATRWQPEIDAPDEFIGESVIVRVAIEGERTPEIDEGIRRVWTQSLVTSGPQPESFARGRPLRDRLLGHRADWLVLLPAPLSGSNRAYDPAPDTWWSVQTCDLDDEPAVDDFTLNDVRRLEGYAHKIARLVGDYDRHVRRYLEKGQQALDPETGFWLNHFPVHPGRSTEIQERLHGALGTYLRLSTVASQARQEQVTLRLNLANLDRRRAEVEHDGENQIYAFHSERGHRTVRQIDGDLDYIDTMLRQTDAILRSSDTRLRLERQDLEVWGARIFTSLLFALSAVQLWGLFLTVHSLNSDHSTFWRWPDIREWILDGTIVFTFALFFALAVVLWRLFARFLLGSPPASMSASHPDDGDVDAS